MGRNSSDRKSPKIRDNHFIATGKEFNSYLCDTG
jgi:hypothetical protein